MKKIIYLIAAILLSSCATTDNLGDLSKRFEEIKKIETLLFNQMPLPKDARISPDKSLILGEGDNWAGRIEFKHKRIQQYCRWHASIAEQPHRI